MPDLCGFFGMIIVFLLFYLVGSVIVGIHFALTSPFNWLLRFVPIAV